MIVHGPQNFIDVSSAANVRLFLHAPSGFCFDAAFEPERTRRSVKTDPGSYAEATQLLEKTYIDRRERVTPHLGYCAVSLVRKAMSTKLSLRFLHGMCRACLDHVKAAAGAL